jgi:hypothetical protein
VVGKSQDVSTDVSTSAESSGKKCKENDDCDDSELCWDYAGDYGTCTLVCTAIPTTAGCDEAGATTTASKKKSSDALRSTSVSVFATLLALSAALVSSRQ